AERREKDIEDTLAKLDALARRQLDLANQQPNPQQSFQQRWEQEMLRREAEQLQRQMQQLAQSSSQAGPESAQSGKQPGPSSQSGQAGSQSSRSQASGGQSSEASPSDSSSNPASDQRIQQALSRIEQATGAMKRGDDPGQNTNAQKAAQQLRQASNLLAGTQQQLASGKIDTLTREADRLRQEESAQANRIKDFASQDAPQSITDLDAMLKRRRQLTQMAQDRQQLSDRLSNLQTSLRDAAREMASNQPGVAENLRDALKEMDNSDLDNRVQRSADWLRSGINPNANGTEDQIAQGLAKLSQQLQQAQKAVGPAGQGEQRGAEQDQAALVDQVERLRNQMESMTRSLGRRGQAGQNGQPGESVQGGQDGEQHFSEGSRLSRNGAQAGQAGGQNGLSRGQDNGQGQNPRQRGQSQQAQSTSNGGGRAVDGTVWNNINTGNNRYGQPRQQPQSATDSLNSA